MKYAIGLFISIVGFTLASHHLNQAISEYWDFVAFFVVIFGTASVLMISFPAISMKFVAKIFTQKFLHSSGSLKGSAQVCMNFFSSREVNGDAKGIEADLLRDGRELISLGFKKEKVSEVLAQRFENHVRKMNLMSAWMKRNAKYPPAFGLAGTVLGLIHLMRGISNGIDTKETGLRMAVALVATFYGLLIANLVLNPLGEWLSEEIKKEEVKAEMAIDTVMAVMSRENSVEFQETLNSYLEAGERIDLVTLELQKEVA